MAYSFGFVNDDVLYSGGNFPSPEEAVESLKSFAGGYCRLSGDTAEGWVRDTSNGSRQRYSFNSRGSELVVKLQEN